MRLIASAFLVSIMLGASASIARSEPGPTISYLMDEPVSMLTFGLWKLQTTISSVSKDALASDYFTYTDYDWTQNRIILGFGTTLATGPTKEMCRRVVDRTRAILGVSPTDGKPTLGRSQSYLATYFEQNGHRRPDEPKELGQRLDQVALIQLRGLEKVFCEAPLLGTQIDFRE